MHGHTIGYTHAHTIEKSLFPFVLLSVNGLLKKLSFSVYVLWKAFFLMFENQSKQM